MLNGLESWLREKMKTLSRHSEMAKAFAYALNQWAALTYYTKVGSSEVDNNIAENALRRVSLGRKNFLFFGSDHGGERGALLYSVLAARGTYEEGAIAALMIVLAGTLPVILLVRHQMTRQG